MNDELLSRPMPAEAPTPTDVDPFLCGLGIPAEPLVQERGVEAARLAAAREMLSAIDAQAAAFTIEPGRKGYDRSSVLAVQRMPVRSGQQTLAFVTDKEPNYAGVDPFNKWIDRNSDDNVKEVIKAESLAAASRL